MAIQTVKQLKAWFRKGLYPTEGQFADLIDSFRHKGERVPIQDVEGLTEAVNGKYDSSEAAILEKKVQRHDSAIEQLQDTQESQDLEIADIHQTDEAQQAEIDAARGDIARIRDMIKAGASLDEAKVAFAALGRSYGTLYDLASTVKTFLSATDTKDTTINTWRELEAFLQGVTDTESLTALLNQLERKITLAYGKAITDAIKENQPAVSVTYAELIALRNSGNLRPGVWYRITDYETTVANDPEANSAGHCFDVVVFAIDSGTLSEEARAMHSERDTDGYFAGARLEAWKVWYCPDNDTGRFQWAHPGKGTGVIYRLIDEWGNDCPYDFKNIRFKRYCVIDNSPNGELSDLEGQYAAYNRETINLAVDATDYIWAYTFSLGDRTGEPVDASMVGFMDSEVGAGYGNKGYFGDNVILPTTCRITMDDTTYSVFCLNNVIWFVDNTRYRSLINGTRVGSECFNMTLSGHGTTIGHDCQNFIFGDQCLGNTFGPGCSNIVMGTGCQFNTFGNDCYSNTFGNDCYENTFGNYFQFNTFGNSCGGNTFGNYFRYNTFGNGCYSNTFGNDCGSNTFGNDCTGNTFGNSCWSNTFGNDCDSNTFGNYCILNTFGNYLRYTTVNDGVQYVEVPGGTGTSRCVQYAQILNGTCGVSSSNRQLIAFEVKAGVCQFAGRNSAGELKIWTPADLV